MRHRATRAVLLWSCAGWAAFAARAQDPQQTGSGASSTESSGITRWWRATHGSLEAGAWWGDRPFYLNSGSSYGFSVRGDWSLSLLKIPLRVQADLGNVAPERGQRNRFTVQVDQQALLRRAGLDELKQLKVLEHALDSLRDLRAMRYRELVGLREVQEQQAQIEAVPDSATGQLLPADLLTIPDTLPAAPVLPAGAFDSAMALLPTPTLPTSIVDSVAALVQLPSTLDIPNTISDGDVQRAADSLGAVEDAIARYEQQQAKLQAVAEAGRKNKVMRTLAQGLRRVQIGQCTAAPSEFLINGLAHVGISFEVASRDLYVAFDHGRSYDDVWRSNDAGTERLRQLQRTVFFEDAEDLNPRRLTAAKVGVGLPEGTHLHLGYLYGKRDDAPLGSAGAPGNNLVGENHVVELDAGLEVAKGHGLRVVLGRSLFNASTVTDDGDDGFNALLQRGERRNQALLVAWRSRFDKSRTEITAAYRGVDPLFHSMGMAFVRNGSRSGEASVAQRFGRRLRLKATGKLEERVPVGGSSRTELLRGRIGVGYKPSEAWNLRATYAPLVATTVIGDTTALVQRSEAWQCGADYMRRFGKKRLLMNADAMRYGWTGTDSLATASDAWSLAGAATMRFGDRAELGIQANAFLGEAGDPWTASPRFAWHGRKGAEVSVNTVWDGTLGGWGACNTAIKLPLGKNWYSRVEGGWFRSGGELSLERFAQDDDDNYNCRVLIGRTW